MEACGSACRFLRKSRLLQARPHSCLRFLGDFYPAKSSYHDGSSRYGSPPWDWPTEDLGVEPELLRCRLCGSRLCLVAQIYAPLAKFNIEERTLYVLVCPTRKCSPNPQSWKVLRVQKCHSGMQTNCKVDELVQKKDIVCSNGTPPSSSVGKHKEENNRPNSNDDDFDLDALAEALEQAATLASNTKKKTKSKRANNVPAKCAVVKEKVSDLSIPVLPCFYIYYDKEQSRGKSNVCSSSNEEVLVEEIMAMGDDEEEKWEGEKYEYDSAPGADRTFLKFKKRLDAYPQQCFRYSYAGKPLLATTNSQGLGTCKLCGSPRHYELQLMSPLSYFLDQAGDGSSNCAPNAWTWLTLVVYSCSKNCCPSSCGGKLANCCWGIVEEEIMIQEDEACNA